MSDSTYLNWPFFAPQHAALAQALEVWCAEHLHEQGEDDVDGQCRALVRALGEGGWLKHAVAGSAHGGHAGRAAFAQ